MFSHPVTVFGYIAVVIGLLLAFFSGGASGYGSALMMYFAGVALMAVGPFMILLGVIAQGFLRIEKHLAGIPRMKAAFEAYQSELRAAGVGQESSAAASTDEEAVRRKLIEKGFRP